MNLLRKILIPIVPIYYLATWFRNKLYDWNIKKSISYDFPVIAIGNLSVGGTGKSPMVEYLIKLLQDRVSLATLSRGYKRETKGFQRVEAHHTAKAVGDEPLQFKIKFPDILVGVDEDRRNGIKELRSLEYTPEVILLDDAFQHRKVKAGLYMLLTAYDDLYCKDIVLPTGNLREPRSGAIRANIIIVTKCPKSLSPENQSLIAEKLNIRSWQKLFFTTIQYDTELKNQTAKQSLSFFENKSFVLVTGIANPEPLISYYKDLNLSFEHKNFPDHHNFREKELQELRQQKYIITTEKDYVRLKSHFTEDQLWYQPMQIVFIKEKEIFDNIIMEFIKK